MARDVELPPLIGESTAFQETLAQVSRLAPLERPVLIVGERGTGKELMANRLTFLSRRWEKPFVQLNCAALLSTVAPYGPPPSRGRRKSDSLTASPRGGRQPQKCPCRRGRRDS